MFVPPLFSIASAQLAGLAIAGLAVSTPAFSESIAGYTSMTPLYRYYNPTTGDHFFTISWSELGSGSGGYQYEGVQCRVLAAAEANTEPVYRYRSHFDGRHGWSSIQLNYASAWLWHYAGYKAIPGAIWAGVFAFRQYDYEGVAFYLPLDGRQIYPYDPTASWQIDQNYLANGMTSVPILINSSSGDELITPNQTEWYQVVDSGAWFQNNDSFWVFP